MSYLKELAKVSGNEFANLVDDGIFGGDVDQFIDTGSYVFNALLSGSIYGGLPANKITAIAGESATGKTFFTLGLVKRFLDMNEKAGVIYFESESALTSDMLREREIDVNRVIHIPVSTVEEFRIQAVKILENHVYDQIGSMYPQKVMGGGSAVQYAASSIVFLSKRKEKEGTEVIGNIIHCKMQKSRMTKENKMVDVLLTYKDGLHKYYGLLEMAEAAGVFKKVATRYELPDGSKLFGKQILSNPDKYFTEEVLNKIDNYTQTEYTYGRTSGDDEGAVEELVSSNE